MHHRARVMAGPAGAAAAVTDMVLLNRCEGCESGVTCDGLLPLCLYASELAIVGSTVCHIMLGSLSRQVIRLTLKVKPNPRSPAVCTRAEPAAFRALVTAAAQGDRQLKDTLVALLLARRDRVTPSAALARSQPLLEPTDPADGPARSWADVEPATDGRGDETAAHYTDGVEDVEDDG